MLKYIPCTVLSVWLQQALKVWKKEKRMHSVTDQECRTALVRKLSFILLRSLVGMLR